MSPTGSKTTNLNVAEKVLEALVLNSDPQTNPKFKIEHIAANKFKFHETPFTLVDRTMKFENGEFELTDNLLDALTNKNNDLKKLTAKEKTDFYLILRKTNSLVSGDHKSKRGKAILELTRDMNRPAISFGLPLPLRINRIGQRPDRVD